MGTDKLDKYGNPVQTKIIKEVITDGKKHDGGKLRYDLVPPEALEALCDVMTFGANKYSPNGWREVEKERYVAALYRHLIAWQKGETMDQESGKPHLAHALTNVAFLLMLGPERLHYAK